MAMAADSSSLQSTSSNTSQSQRRHSLALLTRLPKDFSSLLRSHSTRQTKVDDPFLYAEMQSFSDDNVRDRSRLYNFLHRSRSRSRSRPKTELDVVPDLPSTPASKPATRIQSRPLSSTTTATNTTITPATPTQKSRRHMKHPPDPILTNQNTPNSRPSTPKPSAARKKLHNLFGIPLSPRKSTFPGTNNGSHEIRTSNVPPDDSLTPNDTVTTPSTSTSTSHNPPSTPTSHRPMSSSSSLSRTHSPSPRMGSSTNVKMKTNVSSGSSSRLAKFFGGASTPPTRSTTHLPSVGNLSRSAPSAYLNSVPLSDPSAVSGPSSMKPYPQVHRRSNSNSTSISRSNSTSTSRDLSTSIHASTALPLAAPQPRAGMPVPRITHTPPTPVRSATSPPRLGVRTDNMGTLDEPRERYRPMAIVDEEEDVGKGKARPREGEQERRHGAVPMMRDTSSSGHGHGQTRAGGTGSVLGHTKAAMPLVESTMIKGRKHGSFDFEKPGWRAGIAGIGAGRREAQQKLEKEKEKEREREREKKRRPSAETVHTGSSTHTQSTSATGLSSSLGRAAGKKVRYFGGGRSHGLFAFEPAVPNPATSSYSGASEGSRERVNEKELEKEKQRGREKEVRRERRREKEKEREKEREREKQRAVPVPIPMPAGYRSGTKGRSLDLGLGLAWAPTKVREEALLPSGYGRSLSASSRNAERSRNGVGNRAHVGGESRSKVGREVAEVFRSALSEEGYAAFKRYVHQFDAHAIPFDGPTGIITRVERLLETAPDLSRTGKRDLLENFIRVILQNA